MASPSSTAAAGPLLAQRSALVTGAGGGIGAAIAERFALEGADVCGVDRPGAGNDTAAHWFQCDFRHVPAVAALADQVVDTMGGPDILVNCAGINHETPSADLPIDLLEEILTVNLKAAVVLACRFGAGMAERGYGRIVNITSVHGSYGQEACLAYDVSKAGLNQATRSLAVDFAPGGVLVNAVAPGFVDTPASRIGGTPAHEQPWFLDVYERHRKLPLGRQAAAAEIAAAVAWLASEHNSYMTGHVLTLDGGLTATF
jgi:NAD(P)-dependent dehydrogenase (short-subunit alcohol dehydrogenase family)